MAQVLRVMFDAFVYARIILILIYNAYIYGKK